MPPAEKESTPADEQTTPKKKDRAAEIADTFEWLITAFILAFVFRAFVMEAFRIPTGSMADTLKGAHFRLRCLQCGHQYEHGFVPSDYRDRTGRQLQEDTVPHAGVTPPQTRCPNCGNHFSANDKMPVANGDRILVLKCIYQFFEPKRWDVIVFKNPNEPYINYIKRLVALPGDKIEIIDGDVYIDGKISRKPPKVQNELWMTVYDNDYQPVNPDRPTFNLSHTKPWRQPFINKQDSKWVTTDKEKPTQFRLDGPPDQVNSIAYDSSIGNDFKASYAYNSVDYYKYGPTCSDLMVRFYSMPADLAGNIGASLSKYETNYKASIDPAGQMTIASVCKDVETVLATDRADQPAPNKWTLLKFANVDHQLIFEFGKKKISCDLGLGPNAAGPIRLDIEPQVEIFGSGKLALCHVTVFRDIHYTSGRANGGGRAANGEPFELHDDEFFVLGDNSPNSQDARWWDTPGKANNGVYYRPGVVPRDYLVGKALFVYWPSGFRPFDKFPIAAVPNIGKMRFIYGGKD
ncbi:MAG TPA: signal peptidase I [Sedimentisphaerales bacterium]|nr:signal peptidase I [Sedimentisphaerales bacterium]